MSFKPPAQSTSTLKIANHVQRYRTPPTTYTSYFNPPVKGKSRSRLVASAAVIHANHILLLQRASHGFQPLRWELPGGRCETHDESVIASAVRELWEESGLIATRVVDVVGEYEWVDKGERWKKITFLVDVDAEGERLPQVKIDPDEQEAFIWATREDVLHDRCGEILLCWTSDEQKQAVLDAFALRG